MANNIAKRWRVLSGEDDWEGLLDPLDLDLRRYVIHYGERAQSIADAFIAEPKSANCGLSRYPAEGFFSHVGLEKGNPYKYEVTTFFYAAYGDLNNVSDKVFKKSVSPEAVTKDSNCIGYVAVATNDGKIALGRRDILVVWRGSMVSEDWTADFKFDLVSAKEILGTDNNPKVHKGWYTIYTATNTSKFNRTSARDQQNTEEEVSITVIGYLMGAALAALNAVDMAYNKVNVFSGQPNKTFPITAFVFASPRVGDRGFGSVFSDLNSGAAELHFHPHQRITRRRPPMPSDFQRLRRCGTVTTPHGSQISLHEAFSFIWLPPESGCPFIIWSFIYMELRERRDFSEGSNWKLIAISAS
ncbi:Fungal lipase-like domain containing protein [Trema orientale]|uniref:Phospholipase A1 n=1 Tax=Trema orientale TaxID=63057 RepID=A0A2P5DCL3_TREOI|nr:Fungal lipase-like domain containing protein [Trema orientale]